MPDACAAARACVVDSISILARAPGGLARYSEADGRRRASRITRCKREGGRVATLAWDTSRRALHTGTRASAKCGPWRGFREAVRADHVRAIPATRPGEGRYPTPAGVDGGPPTPAGESRQAGIPRQAGHLGQR